MSETPSPGHGGPQISTNPSESGNANLIYILYLIGIVSGVTAIIGVVMAYLAKDEAPEWLRSHYRNQIHIFWKGLVYSVISCLLMIVLVGFILIFVAAIWFIIRTVKGMQALSKGEPYPNPDSWGF